MFINMTSNCSTLACVCVIYWRLDCIMEPRVFFCKLSVRVIYMVTGIVIVRTPIDSRYATACVSSLCTVSGCEMKEACIERHAV
jgi:hypothetical protein